MADQNPADQQQEIAAALQRAQNVFARRPEAAEHDDSTGTARWAGGLRVATSHPNGKQVYTDMPSEFGGGGAEVTPGWMVRAGLASCTATTILMTAATQGIALDALEVQAHSRSDSRGMLGMVEADGSLVYPGPHGYQMVVRIAAQGVAPERLRTLVEDSQRMAPMMSAVQDALPVVVRIEAGALNPAKVA